MYKLALFDLDGTLTDPKVGITKSLQYALAGLGIEVADPDTLTKFIGPPLRDTFGVHYGFSPEKTEQAVAKYREYYSEYGIFENEVYPGIVELLERLRLQGVTMAIATSKPTVYAERIAEHFGFGGYFALIQGSELDGSRSRKAEVIARVLERIPGRNAVMIGDREHDIIGAKEHGLGGIGVLWGYGSREELQAAGAGNIAETMEEILDFFTPAV